MIKVKRSIKQDDSLSEGEGRYSLILFNDEINTFEFVIKTLMDVCEHNAEQAYQCALIAHHKGKCEVKKGMKEDLKNRCAVMLKKGLSAEII